MAGPKMKKTLPTYHQVVEASSDPASLVALGDSAVDLVMATISQYDEKWTERLVRAVGTLKDAIESGVPINSATAELKLLLLRPVHVPRTLSRAEIDEVAEPSEEEIEAWAWGVDLAGTTGFFVVSAVSGVLSLLFFAVIIYGFESPGMVTTITFLSFGSIALFAATGALGAGLYQHYVVRGHISWKWNGYPDANVKRQGSLLKTRRLYAYVIGGLFLASSVGLGVVVSKGLLRGAVTDYTGVRLALLFSMAVGLLLSGIGAMPIVRRVVATAEVDRRLGRAKHLSPRLLLTLLPILTGTISFLINWLFL